MQRFIQFGDAAPRTTFLNHSYTDASPLLALISLEYGGLNTPRMRCTFNDRKIRTVRQALLMNWMSYFSRSPITPNELSRILGSSKVSISAKNAKDGTPSPSSDEQSTSGTFSMTSQEFSLSEDANICFRRPMGTNSEESPIRCICSCISEHGGNCDCSEENIDDLKEQKRVDSGVGQEEDETTPKPTRSKYPVIMPGRQHQQSLNPFYLLRAQSGRRNSLWKP